MKAELHLPDIEESIRRVVREEIERAGNGSRLYNVASAALYLDMSKDGLRAAIKRRQIECNRSETGRITFTRAQLDAHATAGD
jgi:hypothetical protein